MDTQDYLLFLFSFVLFIFGAFCGYMSYRIRHKTIGDIEIFEDDRGIKRFSLVINSDPDDLTDFKRVIFNIKDESSS